MDPFRSYLINEVHSIDLLVIHSKTTNVWSPGDKFHKNPLALAMVGLHPNYYKGVAVSGNSTIGVVAIRCSEKEVQSSDWVCFDTLQQQLSQMWIKTFSLSQMVRVLVNNGKNYVYYLANMFIHKMWLDEHWKILLRGFPKNSNLTDSSSCYCCE
jgi:alpha-galactosidase/6-phospho-beta-glucosidase family protein